MEEKEMKKFYQERIGKKYGMFEVTAVEYEREKKKQRWEMQCVECGAKRITYNGRDYVKGRNAGRCSCANKPKEVAAKKTDPTELIGGTFGDFVIEDYVVGKGLVCKCNLCGSHSWRHIKPMLDGTAPKCVCTTRKKKYRTEDWRGQKIKHLTILAYENRHFTCECDCGTIVKVKPSFLLGGRHATCGERMCPYRQEMLHEVGLTHGYSGSRLYKVWNSMRGRCSDLGNKNYGGRGITVCDEWSDFVAFHDWAYANGYDENADFGECTIDRIDVNGNYEPSNCRWVGLDIQANNKRPSKPRQKRVANINGQEKTQVEWCAEYGITYAAVKYRMKKFGLSFEEALTMPKQQGVQMNVE